MFTEKLQNMFLNAAKITARPKRVDLFSQNMTTALKTTMKRTFIKSTAILQPEPDEIPSA